MPFRIVAPTPMNTYMIYSKITEEPLLSVQELKDGHNEQYYLCFSETHESKIKNGKVEYFGLHAFGGIPIVEYPNNHERISDIELVITLLDAINEYQSNRVDSVEAFVSSWVKFVNCDIDEETFAKMKTMGALAVKSNNGENKADVDILSQELNQTESQVAVSDLYDKLLEIQGMSNRQKNSGGDTGSAVLLRNGFYNSEKRAELSEPIFKRAERMTLRLILNRLRIEQGISLLPSDVEIKISRSKLDNMLTKAEVLQILLNCGIDNERAIKTVSLFSDPEQVAIESRDRMNVLYPKDANAVAPQNNNTQGIE